jgi:hypothetical protein
MAAWARDSVVLYPLTLSLFSALIFWLAFSFAPFYTRRRKIRPLVELDIINIRNELFTIFDKIMGHALFSPSHFQLKIRSGLLTEEDIKLGIQNKCLNENYLYDSKISNSLLVIGSDIFRRVESIDRLVNKVLNFSQFAHPDEIILLERIREAAKRYDFGKESVEKSPATKIGGNTLFPVVPNISYRTKNFSELYSYYLELQRLSIKHFRYMDRNVTIHNVQYLFGAGKYTECIAYAKRNLKHAPDGKMLIWNYICMCLYKIGAKESAYRELYYIYKDRPHNGNLVSSRTFLEHLLSDSAAMEILLRTHSASEVEKLKRTLEQERSQRRAFLQQNQMLLDYFENKKANVASSA